MRDTKVISLLLIFSFLLPVSNLFVEADDDVIVPTARAGHSMVYASYSKEIIVFGGMKDNINIASSYLNDTWKYSYSENKWIELNPTTGPSSRTSPSMVYDPINDRVLLFGGTTYNRIFNDTWELNFDTYEWRKIETVDAPSEVADAQMIFDEYNQEILLFGGSIPQGYFDETWIFDVNSNVWNQLTVSNHPSSRYGHRMVYSSSNDVIYLFGGHAFNITDTVNNDMWYYDCSSKAWSEIPPPPSLPSSRYWHELLYDIVNERIILFGGRKSIWSMDCWGDTWEYGIDSTVWSEIPDADNPPARMYFSMVYHSVEEKAILFGGCQDPNILIFDDMWSLDLKINKCVKIDPNAIHTSTTNIQSLVFLGVFCIISIIWQYRTKRR